ncbi:AGAP005928-PB [Anopheles gambiae str. PEST]|uniref:AGAP005928-PB n=1 Tax=Anopheles gambiae TaxID=7165 RepID=Q7Q6C2_ANOGA|nr:AGAP005928-PB [Anopheles gambiae str. PEST]
MSGTVMLFACSKCFSRHPFEELSPGQQLCKDCRGSFPVVKCTYCRSEFQQTSKGSTSAICRKCEANVKQYGKPSACELCNIIAAFIGSKCQRCTNSELKYGPAVTCDQCKQRCAFNRPDYKVDGKLLCWLCTLSYKRALTKARQVENERRRAKKRAAEGSFPPPLGGSGMSSLPPLGDLSMSLGPMGGSGGVGSAGGTGVDRIDSGGPGGGGGGGGGGSGGGYVDPHSSDHVIAMTQLKETIATLQRKLKQKDSVILEKEKEISAWKGKHFHLEQELMKKYKDMEKNYEFKVDVLNKKLKAQLLEIAALSKAVKERDDSKKKKQQKANKSNGSSTKDDDDDSDREEEKDDRRSSDRGSDDGSEQGSDRGSERGGSGRGSDRSDNESDKESDRDDHSDKGGSDKDSDREGSNSGSESDRDSD